ncbi:fibronectin type III domain-containing protein [uncultured Tenacibaculum sp.]|uniref:fibronectin type III domain-containing protein n=1 Tax=uncultured Tenacibaculum sp. TaxID=174713 RepID=UPI002606E8F2|nr:fibronectin type III domain-containing protein [uncultured Tenacibaculum sp.]
MLQRVMLIIGIFFTTLINAQTYPVQVTPQLIPPYSLKISDYATLTNEKLYVNILLTDVNEIGRRVRLKMYIEGQGLSISSHDMVRGAAPIFVDGGINLRLSNLDLQPYFELNNLLGITPQQYNNPLPNGGYNFCFEVYDYFTNRLLSAKNCTTVFLLQNDPPILNLPFRDNIVTASNPQNILFTWTPRHSNVSNVQYEFTLKEIWDVQNPQANFLASVPFYQTTTYNPTLLVGPDAPQLLSGKIYGWQVRAFVSDGIDETSVFKNDGRSEIFWFKYLQDCAAPTFVISQALTAESVQINWQISEHLRYRIQYRKKGYGDDDWFEVNSYTNEGKIYNLEADTTYEFRVGGECTQLSGFAYSNIQEFTTPTNDEAAYYNCGLTPEINITNQEPLPKLGVNETFTAGDFPVVTREVTGSNGTFSGWGYITLPFLENIKEIIDAVNIASQYLGNNNEEEDKDKKGFKLTDIGKYTRIKVKFNNVSVNSSYQLTQGVVVTEYDAEWSNILDVDNLLDDVFGDDGGIQGFDGSNTDIKDITVDDNGTIIVHPENGEPFPIDVQVPTVITDSEGQQWTVDEDGKVSGPTKQADGGVPDKNNTEGINGSGTNNSVKQISSKDVEVTFARSGYYSTDLHNESISSSKYKKQYEFIKKHDDSEYPVLYKLISDIPEHEEDEIKANVTFANGKSKKDVVFKTLQGAKVETSWANDNTAILKLKRKFVFGKEEIVATVKPKDSTGKYTVAGKLNLWHAQQRNINLTLVSVDGAPIDNIEKRIKQIYNKAGIDFNISKEAIKLDLKDLDVGDSDILSHYTEGEKKIIEAFKKAPEISVKKDQYYIFFLKNSVKLTNDINGFMPLKRQFGFVFKEDDAGRIAAHEIGHGIFGLKHPWDQYETKRGASTYLMDSGNTGTDFSHMDWQKLHAPGIQLYWFQGDEAGEFSPSEFMIGYNVIPDAFSNYIITDKSGYSFVSKAGKFITIPKNVKDVTFGGNGELAAFTLPENGKLERYVAARKGEKFRGFVKSLDSKIDWKKRVYKDKISNTLGVGVNLKVYTGKLVKTKDSCGIDLYEGTFKNNVDKNEWNSGGNGLVISNSYIAFSSIANKKLLKKKIKSPEACDLCTKGEKFYNDYSYLAKNDVAKQALIKTAKLLCENPAFYEVLLAQMQKDFSENLDNIFWLSDKAIYRKARNKFWEREDAFVLYYEALKRVKENIEKFNKDLNVNASKREYYSALYYLNDKFITSLSYDQKRDLVSGIFEHNHFITESVFDSKRSDATLFRKILSGFETEDYKKLIKYIIDNKSNTVFGKSKRNALFEIAYASDLVKLGSMDVFTKLELLEVLLDGNLTNFFGNNQDAIITKVVKSVKGSEASEFFNQLETSENYSIDNAPLLYNLKKKLSDFFNSKTPYTEFFKEIKRLSDAKNKIDIVGKFIPKVNLKWDVEQKDYVLVSFVSNKNDFIYSYDKSKHTVGIKKCKNYSYSLNNKTGNYSKTCDGWEQLLEAGSSPFELIGITIMNDVSPFTGNCKDGKGQGEICGEMLVIPAIFIDYLDKKVDTQRWKNFGWNTFNVIITVSTFGEGAAAISAIRSAQAGTRLAVAGKHWYTLLDFTYTVTDLSLKVANVDMPKEWGYVGYLFAAKTSYDLLQQGGLKGLAYLKKSSRSKRKEIVDELGVKKKGEDLSDDDIEDFIEEAEKKIQKEGTKEIKDEYQNALKNLDNFDVFKQSVLSKIDKFQESNEVFREWVKKLDDNPELIKNLDELDVADLEQFAKDFDFGSTTIANKFIGDTDLVKAWRVLKRFPKIRVKEGNVEVLAKIHKRFQYNNEESFKGLNKLFNEGSEVASKQKLLDGLKEVNKLFETNLPVKFSAIKRGNVTVNYDAKIVDRYGRGEELARYVDGILQKKKVIPDGDEVKIVKEGETPDEDLLRKGDELGYRRIAEESNLANYTKLRNHLGNSRIKQYLKNKELRIFEKTIKRSNPKVLEFMNKLDEFDFAEVVRGYRDLKRNEKLGTFDKAISNIEDFSGKYGWFSYWKLTPGMKYSLTTIEDLKNAGLLLPTGKATDIQLASIQAFTRKGDFINVPMRYNKSYLGEYAEKGFIHVKECLEELRKISSRNYKGKTVVSGKTFTKSDFESKFVNGTGKDITYESFISTTTKQSVAEGFTKLTVKWAGEGEKVAIIQRIVTKDGVYIDDLSDWGANLGPSRHANEPISIQVQDEVLLSPSKLEQTGEPIPVMENGQQKLIHFNENGVEKTMKVYYVDFKQI